MARKFSPAPDYLGYDEGHRLPRLVRLYIWQCLIGFGLSGIFTALLLWFDVAGLRTLAFSTQGGFMALGLLFLFNGIVFAGVQFAISIMRMADDDDDEDQGGRRHGIGLSLLQPSTIPVRSRDRR